MIIHRLGNSYSRVEGLSINEMRELKELLSYSIDPKANYFSGGYGDPKRYLIDAKGNYPSGLNYLVKRFLQDTLHVHQDSRVEPKAKPGLFKLSLEYTPYPEQKDAVETCKRFKRGTISAVTGFGKSITMALLVEALQVKTLIVVPNTTLKRQLSDSFLQYFGSLDNITIENIDSPKLKKAKDYDCLIIDECHHSAAKTYRSLNKNAWDKIYYRFAFSATPFRSREEEQLLYESVAGHIPGVLS